MGTRPAWPEPPITLNRIAAGWRSALAAAQGALAASSNAPSPLLTPEDLRQRASQLTHERETVASLLQADARVEHVHLVRGVSLPTASRFDVSLPPTIEACIFDLDGVLAPSDELHFEAWAITFDDFLLRRMERGSVHFSHYARFSRRADYEEQIHGKPRLDGVRAFLASRGITLPEGTPNDSTDAETVWGLANHKNAALQGLLRHEGVNAYAGSHRYLQAVADAGLSVIVVSASANTAAFLEHAGLADLVDARVDGITMREHGLHPTPAPDLALAACEAMGVAPTEAAAFVTTDDAVTAARTAGIRFVVGVDRSEERRAPLAADVTVRDLAEMLHTRSAR